MKIQPVTVNSHEALPSINKGEPPQQSFKDIFNSVFKTIGKPPTPPVVTDIKSIEIKNLIQFQGTVSQTHIAVELISKGVESVNATLRRFQSGQ